MGVSITGLGAPEPPAVGDVDRSAAGILREPRDTGSTNAGVSEFSIRRGPCWRQRRQESFMMCLLFPQRLCEAWRPRRLRFPALVW